jgi:hypothetical protein
MRSHRVGFTFRRMVVAVAMIALGSAATTFWCPKP